MNDVQVNYFENMIGKTIGVITGKVGHDEMRFVADDGSSFMFYHVGDCCESVQIEDIIGDLSDLIGSPLVQAEEVSMDEPYAGSDSYTWTFYKFSTAKGSVTVRWLGESNGYYSESVSYSENLGN
jgi:hypothetical protein